MQTGELIIIAIVALIVLGPTKLPDIARKLGRWTTELRTAAREITRGLESEVNEFREVGRELKAPIDDVTRSVREIGDDVRSLDSGMDWKGPKPISGPTPEDAMRDLEEIEGRADSDAPNGDERAADDDG
jgi:Tat protein translocase TatB subunit